jgi:hypothetical protein
VGWWGQKVLSRPLADSFAVGRRQKVKLFSPFLLRVLKTAVFSKRKKRWKKSFSFFIGNEVFFYDSTFSASTLEH